MAVEAFFVHFLVLVTKVFVVVVFTYAWTDGFVVVVGAGYFEVLVVHGFEVF